MKVTIPLLALFSVLLTSCGGLSYYKHPAASQQSAPQLAPVTLRANETIKLLKHSRGIAIVGGYIEGVAIEDTSIARVHYGKENESDRFAPLARLTGISHGSTRAVYCNRLGERPDFTKPLPEDFQRRSFVIHVK